MGFAGFGLVESLTDDMKPDWRGIIEGSSLVGFAASVCCLNLFFKKGR